MSDPYLLLTFIPLYRDAAGRLYTDRLWQRDLVRHFDYIPHVRLACPVRRIEDAVGVDLAHVEVPEGTRFEIVELPWTPSVRSALMALPHTMRVLHRGIRDAGLVHSGIVGWPYPLGWIANAMAMAQQKPLVLVVESTPWRIAGTGAERPVHVLRALTTEALGRFFVNRADLTFFTHEGYRRELSTNPRGRAFITPAAWIDEKDVLTRDEATRVWQAKRERTPRFVYPSRLLREKGTDVLLDALRTLEAQGTSVQVDVIGVGDRRSAFEEAAQRLRVVKLRFLEPVSYGEPFFRFLDGYHAVLVPQLGDEQPRILFDAYARALPVLASDTPGVSAFVEDRVTGRLHARGDATDLAALLEWAHGHGGELERMGIVARERALTFTHRAMHEARARVLREHYATTVTPVETRKPEVAEVA
ncbi:glycosyltransferase [Sandaracinus amylolyticus]|uniref:Lipid carrier UDP-N-acetylgalactosaminyltransferase n=1 Tax=Sandaracinus amylolyticus TaxID=927083 RepID=A0A0F6WAC0_9BACT|nr:glycosyltransferase [Sandaracinus amylolyticus]AKF11390.1 Lipid carrier UDP-N-acetylgalactosaminyltransferase [Sandaracinus amylolyticus]